MFDTRSSFKRHARFFGAHRAALRIDFFAVAPWAGTSKALRRNEKMTRCGKRKTVGSVWTWVAIDSESKLAISWLAGNRDADDAKIFIQDVAARLKNRVQLTTDGLKAYLVAVEESFGAEIDYAQLALILPQLLRNFADYNVILLCK